MTGDSGPICTVLAGTNGSGKSSLYERLMPSGEFVNADVIARKIDPENPSAVSLQAGRLVVRRLKELISERMDFVYETTLSSTQSLNIMQAAKRRDYQVDLAFVVLSSVDLNVARVAQRVAGGGHDIPETIIRRRYESAFSRLPVALRISDNAAVFDNTSRRASVLLRFRNGLMIENGLDETVPSHKRLSDMISDFSLV